MHHLYSFRTILMNWILHLPLYWLSIVSKNINDLIMPNYDNFLIHRRCTIYQGIVLLIIHLIDSRIGRKTTIETIWSNYCQLPHSLRIHTILRHNILNIIVNIVSNSWKKCEWINLDQLCPISSCIYV